MTEKMAQPSLSQRLGSLRPPVTPALPSFELIERTIRRVLEKYDAPTAQRERDPERLLAEMQRRIREGDWQKVPMSFATRVADIAFDADYRTRQDLEVLRRFFVAEIKASTRPGFLNPMVRIYIRSYEAEAPHTAELAAALFQAQSRIGSQWRQLLAAVPQLFDFQRAPTALAALMENMEAPWQGLRKIGLRQPHEPGLMDAAHLDFLKRIAPRLDQLDEISRLLSWLRPDERSLRQVGAGKAIDALLRPWQHGNPPREIQTLLIDRLMQFYGHPRVNRHAAWNEVDPDLEHVFLRWLIGADIRFLFRILTEVERGHMWADREHFWWTLYSQGRIDEVWIAFNTDGYRTALQRQPAESRGGNHRFGRQVGDRDKSLLVMRIGDKIVVEGTYSFKVHIFRASSPRIPKLYQREYDVAHVRGLSNIEAISHLGNWQSKVLLALGR